MRDYGKYLEENPQIKVTENRIVDGKWAETPNSIEHAKSVVKRFFEKYPHGVIELG